MNRLERLRTIFTAACELPPEARPAYLDEACAGDDALRSEVLELLGHEPAAAAAFDDVAVDDAVARAAAEALTDAPESIGPYRILDRLGEGGMGTVYLAEQTEPVRRQVALKAIRVGMHTEHVLARFHAERQALAMLDHPGVARLLDAGADELGRPYFVMDLVRGEPITDHCARHELPLVDRLVLFERVCDVIQHAHQRGVLHRDIKPSNVLVAGGSSGPEPRVIDFGIAKIVDTDGTPEASLLTEVGQLVGTPEYMSPEQIAPDGILDTRADVHALGVLLFELLTGCRPFERESDGASGTHRLLRRIESEDPEPPSRRAATEVLRRRLRGDLDWITLRALERDPQRRYQSVAALSDDVRRTRTNEPVTAAPPTASYRLRKLVSRYRGQVVAGGIVVVALLAGAAATAWQAVRATRERDRATEQVARLEAYREFLVEDFLTASSPSEGEGAELRVADLLHSAARAVGTRFADDPVVRADVHLTLGRSFQSLGQPQAALKQLELALDVGSVHAGAIDTLRIQRELATTLGNLGHNSDAVALAHEVWTERRRTIGDDHPETLSAHATYAICLTDADISEGEPVLAAVVDRMSRALGDDAELTLRTRLAYVDKLVQFPDRRAEAVSRARRTAADAERVLGPEHPLALRSLASLAVATQHHDVDRAEAEALLREVWDRYRRVYGPDSSQTITIAGSLAAMLMATGRVEEAAVILEDNHERVTRTLPPDSPIHLHTLGAYANARRALGDLAGADSTLALVLAAIRTHRPDDHRLRGVNAWARSALMHELGRPGADALAREGIEHLGLADRPSGWMAQDVTRRLAARYREDGHLEEAIDLLEESRRLLMDDRGAADTSTQATILDLKDTYVLAGRADDAERTLLDYEMALLASEKKEPAIVVTVRRHLVRFYEDVGRGEAAAHYVVLLGDDADDADEPDDADDADEADATDDRDAADDR